MKIKLKSKIFIFFIARTLLFSATACAADSALDPNLSLVPSSNFTLCGVNLPVANINSPRRVHTYEETVALSLSDPAVDKIVSCSFGADGSGRVLILYLKSGGVTASIFPG